MAEAERKPGEPRSGIERAAIFLMSLGEKEAAEVLKHLSAKDLQKVGTAMAEVGSVSRTEVFQVLSAFSSEVDARASVEDLLRWSAPARAAAGIAEPVLLERNGAQRQRDAIAAGESMQEVFAAAVAETRASYVKGARVS